VAVFDVTVFDVRDAASSNVRLAAA
jgi:hypothetical protein